METKVKGKEIKFPKFIGAIYSEGLTIHSFANLLQEKGYEKKYSYAIVREKLNGERNLNHDDMTAFAKTLDVPESIFFN